MATSSTYCTHRDLKDIYPSMDEFDVKTPIYAWTSGLTNFYDSSFDIFYTNDTGLITNLFIDSAKIDKIAYNTTSTTEVEAVITPGVTSIDVDDTTNFGAADIIKIDNEYMRVVSVTDGNTLSVTATATNRGLFGTASQHHAVDAKVYKIIDASTDLGDTTSAGSSYSFVYDPDLDLCILVGDDLTTNDPNDNLIEAGEDFKTLITRIMKNASRYVDSRIDASVPRDAFKDKEGNYDYFLVRTSSLVAIYFLINAHNPGTDVAEKFLAEATFNIDQINEGNTKLSYQVSGDAPQGMVREVLAPQNTNALHIVDTRGGYTGIFDLIKVIITTGGAIGVAKFDVYVGDSTGLKKNQVVTAELITGQYQSIGNGLQIRFSGKNDSSVATANDEWEIEVLGVYETMDGSVGSGTNTRMTRR